ncbi:hypothetical protein [Salipaludibacillus daqingensis]|uniref:hypothetical protein n=1 Tax=Salipaludibacillus daqingensis TaxID=3041001 RepID=UPI002472E827|nr:hypothetical protein [Salipaludibacillus daqingensis]
MLSIIIFFSLTIIILYRLLTMIKNKTDAMEGMVLTMSLSMALGLIVGIIVALPLEGHLLLSTLVSVAIASLIGLLIGLLFSYHASFEGVFSGLMSAMMAVMIVEMIPMEHRYIFLFASSMFFILTTVFCFMFLLFRKNQKNNMSIVYFGAIIWVIFAFFILLTNTPTSFEQIEDEHEYHTFSIERFR